MFEKIKKLFKREPDPKIPHLTETELEEQDSIVCPNCKGTEWLEGPSGGMSVNIMCNRCHSKYNYMGPFGLDELEIKNDHKDILRDEKINKILS